MFADRVDAGDVLADMLEDFRGTATTIVAVPAGGVPVAVAVAEHLGLPPRPTTRTAWWSWSTTASHRTMLVALESVRRLGAEQVVVAVPTASEHRIGTVAASADAVYCANLRGGARFAVADAHRKWSDVDEAEAVAMFQRQRDH